MTPSRISSLAFAISVVLGIAGSAVCQTWEEILHQAHNVSMQGHRGSEKWQEGQDSAIVVGRRALAVAIREHGPEHSSVGHILNRIGDFYFRKGAYEEAESVWVEALRAAERTSPPAANEIDASLFRLGIYYTQTGIPSETGPEVRRALALRDTMLHSASPDIAARLYNLAQIHAQMDQLADFHDLMRRLLAIWEQAPKSDPRYAIRALIFLAEDQSKPSVGNLGKSSSSQDSALVLARRALTIAEERFGANDTLTAFVAYRLGDYCRRLGRRKEAAVLWERAWEINRAAFPPEHIEVQGGITRMAGVYRATGRFGEAESLLRQAVVLRTKTQGPGHPETAGMYMRLGRFLHVTGEFAEAEQCYRHALAIREDAIERIASDVAQSLRLLGLLYYDQGRYANAEEYFANALAIRESALGPNHTLVASCLNDLANLYRTWGRFEDAEHMLQRALAAHRGFLGDRHPDVARPLKDLASHYMSVGELAQARSLLEEALSILSQDADWQDTELSAYELEMARLSYAEGRLANAERAFRNILEEQEGLLGPNDNRLSAVLLGLARVLVDRQKLPEAEAVYERVLATHAAAPNLHLPVFAQAYEDYARLCALTDRPAKALVLSETAFHIRLRNLRDGAAVMSERDAMAYARRMQRSRDMLLSCYLSADSREGRSAKTPADAILLSKGEISDEVLTRNLGTLLEPDATVQSLNDSLRYASSRLARLYVTGAGKRDPESFEADVAAANSEKRRLETALARNSAHFRREREIQQLDVSGLQSALPPNSSLVEYLRFGLHDFQRETIEPHYLALVIVQEELVYLRDLGPAAVIDSVVTRYRRHFADVADRLSPPDSRDLEEYSEISAALHGLIWSPIASFFPDSSLVLIAPDGLLNVVSFAGLTSGNGRYVIEDHPIHHLSSGRDVIRLRTAAASGTGLLAFGDPDYNALADERQLAQVASVALVADVTPAYQLRNVRSGCDELQETTFARLVGTRDEIESVVALWNGDGPESARSFYSANASEENFKKHAFGNQVIHLATHGFFASEQCRLGQPGHGSAYDTLLIGENPLLQCGLVFAGANLHGEGADRHGAEDGILTAEEISRLNLTGVDWVVLSACESALGKVVHGEGVYGLRRAFQMAGARTVISALWEIPDQSTLQIVRHLYARAGTLPQLLRYAALTNLRDLRERGQPDHPYNWAAFIATGDWRGLE